MHVGILRGTVRLITFLVLLITSSATAATVGVSFLQLSPSTVFITAGEVVYWVDEEEDFGPYIISFPGQNFPVPVGLQFSAPGTYNYTVSSIFGGSWGGSVVVSPGGPNSPPVVTITNPVNNAVFTAPATFAFEVEASDPDPGDLWDVEFWVNNDMVDDVYDPPYATTVTDLPAGTYTLMAIAWDHSFVTTTNSITITVVDSIGISLAVSGLTAGNFEFDATGLTIGKTNVLQTSTNLASSLNWVSVSTNVAASSTASYTNAVAAGSHFFRILELP